MPVPASSSDTEEAGLRWAVPAGLFAVLVGVLFSAAPGTAVPGAAVGAVFPPWWSAPRSFGAVSAAGGSVLRTGLLPGLLIARSADPQFRRLLRAEGAWLLLDPPGSGLCTPPSGTARR